MNSLPRFHPGLSVLALCLVVASQAIAQDPPADPAKEARDSLRKRILDNETWYGSVRLLAHGSGSKTVGRRTDSYSMCHEAEINFRLKIMPGQIEMLAGMEEMKKRSSLPEAVQKEYERLRNDRIWMSEQKNRKPEDDDEIRVLVKDRSDEVLGPPEKQGDMPGFHNWKTLDGNDTRKAAGKHLMRIDLSGDLISLALDGGSDQLAMTEAASSYGKDEKPKAVTKDAAFLCSTLMDAVRDNKLPGEGTLLTGSAPLTRAQLVNLAGRAWDFGSMEGTVTWILSPTPIEDVELVLVPVDTYDDWLPRGGKDEATEGKTFQLKAVLRLRGGGVPKVKMKSIRVRVNDVSNEKGVCLNVPRDGGIDDPDMKFTTEHNPGMTFQDQDTTIRKSGGEFLEVPVTVSCYDWGAWGAIKADAVLTDGRPIWAVNALEPASEELRLPKRDVQSKIADQWKKDFNAAGMKDDADDEKQDGNPNLGDGLTVYEEYRGMFAKGRHTREHEVSDDGFKPLTPRKKDLVLHNTMEDGTAPPNLADVKAGLLLFEKASGIHVVVVTKAEMPESRQVNLNTTRITAGPQFGLRLFDDNTIGAGLTVGTKPRRGEPDLTVSPKGFPKVMVNLDGVKSDHASIASICKAEGLPAPETLSEAIAQTVAHELAHGVGVRHHGGFTGRTQYSEVTTEMTSWKVYRRDGKPITSRPYKIEGGVGEPGNDASGDVSCIMCYNAIYNWTYHETTQTFYAVPILPQGRTFCTSKNGTGPNGKITIDGREIPGGVFGDAVRGNCLSQMRIKDQ